MAKEVSENDDAWRKAMQCKIVLFPLSIANHVYRFSWSGSFRLRNEMKNVIRQKVLL